MFSTDVLCIHGLSEDIYIYLTLFVFARTSSFIELCNEAFPRLEKYCPSGVSSLRCVVWVCVFTMPYKSRQKNGYFVIFNST